MNDIEILEDMISKFKTIPQDMWGKEDLWTMCKYKHYKSIENLIEENKELRIEISARETVVDELEKENKELKEENQQQRHQLNSAFSNGFIHKDKIKAKIEEIDIEIQCCEYADDDIEEYKQDIEKEKRRLLRDKAVLQSLLEKE